MPQKGPGILLFLLAQCAAQSVVSHADFDQLSQGIVQVDHGPTFSGVPFGSDSAKGHVYYGIRYGTAKRFEVL